MSNLADESLKVEAVDEADIEALEDQDFDELVTYAIQELFERLITVENVLMDVTTIVAENAMQPAAMAEKLRELFVPEQEGPQSEKPAAPPDDPSYHTKF